MENLGKHCTLEIYGVCDSLLNDLEFIDRTMRSAAIACGATILDSCFYKFEPQGVTLILLLSESHMSIHTWPEKGSAAIDIYTCGLSKPELALWHCITEFNPMEHRSNCFSRG